VAFVLGLAARLGRVHRHAAYRVSHRNIDDAVLVVFAWHSRFQFVSFHCSQSR